MTVTDLARPSNGLATADDFSPRFVVKIREHSQSECWLWTGFIDAQGYGRFSVRGRMLGAHRVAYMLANGPIPPGLWVLHRCDTPACVRAEHLFLGTQIENMADMVNKGRSPRGRRHSSQTCPESIPRGATHWTQQHPERVRYGQQQAGARLTTDQVVEIRGTYAAGGTTMRVLAEQFGVREQTVSKIVSGKRRARG